MRSPLSTAFLLAIFFANAPANAAIVPATTNVNPLIVTQLVFHPGDESDTTRNPQSVSTVIRDAFVDADWRTIMRHIPGKPLTYDDPTGRTRPRLAGYAIAMDRMTVGTFTDGNQYAYIPVFNARETDTFACLVFRMNTDRTISYVSVMDAGHPEGLVEFTSAISHPYQLIGFREHR
jgi:hypothetical protein